MAKDGKKKILVVSAHGADWCTRSGGTLIKYIKAGAEVTVFALTYGERGESADWWMAHPGGTVEECKASRRKEALAAAKVVGVKDIEFFDYDDYPLEMTKTRVQYLIRRLLEIRPDIMLTHYHSDPLNEDHAEASRAVVKAISHAAMLGALPDTPKHFIPDTYMFESSLPHSEFNGFKMDTYVDISDVFEQKREAVAQFKAQPHLVGYYDRCGARRGEQAQDWTRGRKKIAYAEGFVRSFPFVGEMLPTIEVED
jgi:4-oxalomesaconate hydratase